jgi:hypothetical protein
MRAYLAYDDGAIEELGDIVRDQVASLIDKADASLAADRQFGIGLYRNDKDFFEIRPVGKCEYMIWSDIIAKSQSSGLLGFLFKRKSHIDKVLSGRDTAAEAAFYYMEYPREAFERRYT